MASDKEKYFNFPIQLLEGFLLNDKQVLNDILYYAIYKHYLDYLGYGNKKLAIKETKIFFNVSLADDNKSLERGEILIDSLPSNSPMVGLNLSIFWDYYKNEKTEFEKVTLLGFLAIKSILQNKSYCKITNKYWLSRMDGKTKTVSEYYELSNSLKKYNVPYQLRKIKAELEQNWNLKTVSGRGFNVSFKMSLIALTYEVLKRRKKYKDEVLRKQKNEAKKKALQQLYGTQPKRNL